MVGKAEVALNPYAVEFVPTMGFTAGVVQESLDVEAELPPQDGVVVGARGSGVIDRSIFSVGFLPQESASDGPPATAPE